MRLTLFTGVRKHARKTHLAWLKSVDETAGSRDRHFESKPSTYCVKEEGYSFDDDIEIEEPSPSLTPTMVGLRVDGGPSELPAALSLPEPAANPLSHSAAREVSNAMAAAAAAALVGSSAHPPPPLAWLLAQSAMAQAAALQQQQQQQQQIHSQHTLPPPAIPAPVALPVSLGTMPGTMPPWMPQMPLDPASALMQPSSVLGGSDPRLGFDPLPSCNDWSTDDLVSLFGPPPAPDTAKLPDGVDADPLCLTPPSASALSQACVSPFELEKRPKGGSGAALVKEDARLEMSPVSTTAPFDADDEIPEETSLSSIKEVHTAPATLTLAPGGQRAYRPFPHSHRLQPLASLCLTPRASPLSVSRRPSTQRSSRRSSPEQLALPMYNHILRGSTGSQAPRLLPLATIVAVPPLALRAADQRVDSLCPVLLCKFAESARASRARASMYMVLLCSACRDRKASEKASLSRAQIAE